MLELKEEIKDIPLIDIHSHLNPFSPQAKSIEDIIFYHFIRREFHSAGGDDNFFNSSATLEEKIDYFLKYYTFIENTTNIWCVKKIFKDLYGVDEINKDSLMKIQEKIEKTRKDLSWKDKILKEKLRIEKVFCCKVIRERKEEYNKGENNFFEILPEGLSFGPILGQGFLEFISDRKTKNFNEVNEKLLKFIEEIIKSGYRGIGVAFDYLFEYLPHQENSIEILYNKYLKGENLENQEMNQIMSYFLDAILNNLKSENITFQIYLGALWGAFGGTGFKLRLGESFAIYSDKTIPSLLKIFKKFDRVNFNIYNCVENLNQELTILARMLPNVSLLGFWWHNLYPSYIERMISERIEALPSNKWIFLATDAYCCEWSYGKYSLVIDCLMRVLTEKIDKGYLTLKEAKNLCKRIFYDNPVEIYNLKKRR
ncbi:MAG TPA: hypothetical protein PKV21_00635 [bacterium]|nr:hypothetical protein [bacterium]